MAVLNFLSVAGGLAENMPMPSGVWEWLLVKLFAFVGNYGWRVVVFTICLKLVLLPLDFYQRYSMKKNQKITERIKPEMDKLRAQYGNNQQVLAQKQMELNKKEGFSYFSSCLPMIITLVIFFWLFAGLQNMSQYMSMRQYLQMYDVYEATYNQTIEGYGYEWKEITTEKKDEDGNTVYDEDGNVVYESEFCWTKDGVKVDLQLSEDSDAIDKAQTAVYDAYYADEDGLQVKWLWIKNVWSPDVPWRKPILEFQQFKNNLGKYATKPAKSGLTSDELTRVTSSERYNNVTKKLQNDGHNKNNGYLVLPILSVGLSFLSQFISMRQQKKSGQQVEGAGAGSMKMMMIIMPVMMGFFALSYTAVFTVYIITNSSMTLLINLASTGLLNLIDMKKEGEKYVKAPRGEKSKKGKGEDGDVVIRYGRPDPNDATAQNAPKIQGDTFLRDRKKNKKGKQ